MRRARRTRRGRRVSRRRVMSRRSSNRNSLGSRYDAGYLAKCTVGQDIVSDGTNQAFLHCDWGTPTFAGVTHMQASAEFVQLATTFQQYRVVGMKMKIN